MKTKSADRLVLAGKLFQQGVETKEDLAARYVLLREAAVLAAKASALQQALLAVNEITNSFATAGGALKAEICETVAPAHTGPKTSEFLAEVALGAVDDAIADDEFDAAARLLKVAKPAATRSKTVALVRAVEARSSDVELLQGEAERVKAALAVLEKQPDDADANLAVGKYRCLLKGQWEKGLPNLAKSGDATLKALAVKDLAGPDQAAAQLEVADGWYDLAAGVKGLVKLHLQRRAHHWYQEAAPGLAGLDKTRVEKRLEELDKVIAANTPGPRTNWVVLFRGADPRMWNRDVNQGKDAYAIDLKKTPAKIEFLRLSYPLKNDYVIVPVTRDKLLGLSDDGRYGWNGTNKFEYDGFHLGVYDTQGDATKKKGSICVLVPGAFQGYLGWGFGHDGLKKTQGWTWASEKLEPAVFEIAVTAGPLTEMEAKKVLKK
jgi:hypothetical protein